MRAYPFYDAVRNGETFALVYVQIAAQQRRHSYPLVLTGAWLGTECRDVQLASVPVDHGSIRPFAANDLCVHLYFSGGWATESNGRIRLYQTHIVTRNPVTQEPLASSFVVFSSPTSAGARNHHLQKFGATWYGDILLMQQDAGEMVHIEKQNIKPFMEMTAHLMRANVMTQCGGA